MPTRGTLNLKGLENYLEDLAAAGRDVDEAAKRALAAGGKVALAGMEKRVAVETHKLQNELRMTEPKQDGNYISVHVGLVSADPDIARYGNAQEFGTSSMPAHPYVRPTMDEDKTKINKAMRDSLKEDGTL